MIYDDASYDYVTDMIKSYGTVSKLRFSRIVFDDAPANDIFELDEIDDKIDTSADDLVVDDLMIRVYRYGKNGKEYITFNEMIELTEAGDQNVFFSEGDLPNFFERIEHVFTDALHAVSVAINKIARWWRGKKL